MTARELIAWQRRCRLSDKHAAHALGLAAVTYRKKRGAKSPIGRQTELLCDYVEVFLIRDAAATAKEALSRIENAIKPAFNHALR